VERYCRAGQATDESMAHVHVTRGTYGYKHTLSEYVILITFILQHWLNERASILRWACIACLVHKIDMDDVWLICEPAAGFRFCYS